MTDQTNAVIVHQGSDVTDFGMQAVVSVDQAVRRIKELQSFVRQVMVKGEDYGIIPGTQKPTLLKPGAEKLCEMYGLTPTFQIVDSEKDWEGGFVYYEIKCSLVSKRSGLVAAEGVGSCNNKEKRYKNRDVYDLANTILKMAKKRAQVDAALSATRSSGLFTQDMEDLVDETAERPAPRQQSQVQAPTASATTQGTTSMELATEKQVGAMFTIAHKIGLDDATLEEMVVQKYSVRPSELSRKSASEMIQSLQSQQQGAG